MHEIYLFYHINYIHFRKMTIKVTNTKTINYIIVQYYYKTSLSLINMIIIMRHPNLSELVPILYKMELTHLGPEASIYQ